jgi:hypothetical protein
VTTIDDDDDDNGWMIKQRSIMLFPNNKRRSDSYWCSKRRFQSHHHHHFKKVLLLGFGILLVSWLSSLVFYTTTTTTTTTTRIPLEEEEIIALNYYPYNDIPNHSSDRERPLPYSSKQQQQQGREGTNESDVSEYKSPSSSSSSCLVHRPIAAKFDHVQQTSSGSDHAIQNQSRRFAILQQPSAIKCGRLRRDWTGAGRQRRQQEQQQQRQQTVGVISTTRTLSSNLAREMEAHQSNCSLPVMDFYVDHDYGLGSHLVLWSQALCNAWESNHRIRTVSHPDWLWLDRTYCTTSRNQDDDESPLSCYFPKAENRCPQDIRQSQQQRQQHQAVNVTDPRNRKAFCKRIREAADSETSLREFRRASMEYLFQPVSPLVMAEAERQLGLLFYSDTNCGGGGTVQVPDDLIAVHIRWGDKFWEMNLPSIQEYLNAIEQTLDLQQRQEGSSSTNRTKNNSSTRNETVHIYLATEDPRAVQEFLQQAPAHYKVYVDRTVTELNDHRPTKGNRASWTSRNTLGRAGLVALGSLLVALEAQSFVLTTQSNWSRLIDALRRNVVDAQCGNCTRMIDLRPGDW